VCWDTSCVYYQLYIGATCIGVASLFPEEIPLVNCFIYLLLVGGLRALGSRAGRGYARLVGGTHGSGGLGGLAQWAGRRGRLGPADRSGVRTGLGPGGPGILGWEGGVPGTSPEVGGTHGWSGVRKALGGAGPGDGDDGPVAPPWVPRVPCVPWEGLGGLPRGCATGGGRLVSASRFLKFPILILNFWPVFRTSVPMWRANLCN
jgi:hypothetical protein